MINTKINIKEFKSHQDGIALITTIILSSLMLSSIFIVSREMISEAQNATLLDNSLIAYYSAEAGIEEALLEFRYSLNHEILITDRCKILNNESSDLTIDKDLCGKAFKNKYFKLNAKTKNNNPSSEKIIYKDDVYELPIERDKSLGINWSDFDTNSDSKNIVEFSIYKEDGSLLKKEIKEAGGFQTGIDTSKRILRIRPWYVKNNGAGKFVEGTNPGSGKIPYIKIKVDGDSLKGSIIEINSTGYYGGTARKITANIDKSTGNILNIFDFVLYSNTGLEK